jgi:hypothetical protein
VTPLQTPTAISLQVQVPADALAGPVALTDGIDTVTGTAIFKIVPQIPGFTPPDVVGGSTDVVTVSGTNLRAAAGGPVVKVGTMTVPASLILTSTPTELTFKVPLGAGTGKIAITTAGGTGTSATNLVVNQPPRATSFSPAAAAVGTTVKITGTNLLGVTDVTFTGGVTVAPIGTPTPTTLQVQVPAGALTGPVALANSIGTTTSAAILKLLPRITGFTPVASLDDPVVVSGTNLKTGSADPVVKVGTVPAAVVASSPTEVTFTVPLLAITAKISITTADGTATAATSVTVTP